jgi:hypothetical protein
VLACGLLAGCSKDDPANAAPKVRSLGPRTPPPERPTGAADNAANAPTDRPPSPDEHVTITTTEQPIVTYTVKIRVDGGAAKADPDQQVIDAARASMGSCFTNITNGNTNRFASIHVVVVPSGSVNRTEVSAPGTTEPWILSCLEGVGDGLRFSDKPNADIRNFTISVSASRAH